MPAQTSRVAVKPWLPLPAELIGGNGAPDILASEASASSSSSNSTSLFRECSLSQLSTFIEAHLLIAALLIHQQLMACHLLAVQLQRNDILMMPPDDTLGFVGLGPDDCADEQTFLVPHDAGLWVECGAMRCWTVFRNRW